MRFQDHTSYYELFDAFLSECIQQENSLLDGSMGVFTLKNLEDIKSRFVLGYDGSSRDFLEKYEIQFRDASPGVRSLFAHLVWLWTYASSDITYNTKARQVASVMGYNRRPRSEVFFQNGSGIGDFGIYHKTNKYQEIFFLLNLVYLLVSYRETTGRGHVSLPTLKQLVKNFTLGVRDGKREIVNQTEAYWQDWFQKGRACAMHHAILYLNNPDEYEPILSTRVKSKIANHYFDLLPAPGMPYFDGVDGQLRDIRQALGRIKGNAHFHFLDFKTEWDPKAIKDLLEEDEEEPIEWDENWYNHQNYRGTQFFKFSPESDGHLWETFKEHQIAAIGYTGLFQGSLKGVHSHEGFEKRFPNSTIGWNRLSGLIKFLTAPEGSLVFASKGRSECLGIGILRGAYYFQPKNTAYPHRRKVEWIIPTNYHYKSKDLWGRKYLFPSVTFYGFHGGPYLLAKYLEANPSLEEVYQKYQIRHLVDEDFYTPKEEDIEEPTEKKKSPPISEEQRDAPPNLNSPLSTGEPIEPIQPDPYIPDSDHPLKESENVPEQRATHYFWMQANPQQWNISEQALGEESFWTVYNHRGNKRQKHKHFQAVRPGDLAIAYSSGKHRQVMGLFEFTRGIHQNPEQGTIVSFKIKEKFEYPVHWDQVAHLPELRNSEILKSNQGSLFGLSEEEYTAILSLVDEYKDEQTEEDRNTYSKAADEVKAISVEEVHVDLFLERSHFDKMVSQLDRKQNLILQGPPGVGKTYMAKTLAKAHNKKDDDSRIQLVQFHQNYSYEDFVQGLRPNDQGQFQLQDGVFKIFCDRAQQELHEKFYFIIDEINRGNLSKIFGELMMLLEQNKRDPDAAVRLANEPEKTFFIPPNVYLIGTMNTADRSLALVDYALRRRFAFVDLAPCFNERFKAHLKLPDSWKNRICTAMEKLNKEIEESELGSGFCIGHSYFCGPPEEQDEAGIQNWYQDVIDFEIRPMLLEYWFDDPGKVKGLIEDLGDLKEEAS